MHANVAVHAGDRARLERLAQYCARGPVAMERLETLADGRRRLRYRFKRAWRNGTTHIIVTPLEMLEKLSALVPAPRAHAIRYAGILAPAARWRALIVPAAVVSAEIVSATDPGRAESIARSAECLSTGAAAEASSIEPAIALHGRNYSWAELMKRVWALDVLECPRCHNRMRILAAIHSPDAIGKILDCLGLPSRAPPVSPAVPEFTAPIQPF